MYNVLFVYLETILGVSQIKELFGLNLSFLKYQNKCRVILHVGVEYT